jgi:hypothetical protein
MQIKPVYILNALNLGVVEVKPVGIDTYDVACDPVTSLVYVAALYNQPALAVQSVRFTAFVGGNTLAVSCAHWYSNVQFIVHTPVCYCELPSVNDELSLFHPPSYLKTCSLLS